MYSKRQKASFGSSDIDSSIDLPSKGNYYGLLGKNTQMLAKIEDQKARNKMLQDKISKLKELRKRKLEAEKAKRDSKDTQSSKQPHLAT